MRLSLAWADGLSAPRDEPGVAALRPREGARLAEALTFVAEGLAARLTADALLEEHPESARRLLDAAGRLSVVASRCRGAGRPEPAEALEALGAALADLVDARPTR